MATLRQSSVRFKSQARWRFAIAILLCACGTNEGEPNSVVPAASHHDAGSSGYDAASPIESRDEPELPACLQGQAPAGCAEQPSPPILADWECPAGWLDAPGFTNEDGDEQVPDEVAPFRACAPPDRVVCPTGAFQRTGEVACHAVGEACPAGDFPDGLPATNVIYVLEGASGGDGTQANPFGTLAEAYVAASDGATIAIGKGTYPEALSIDRALTLWGACASEVLIVAPAPAEPEDATKPSTLVGAVDVRNGGDVSARNLTITGARIGLRVYGSASLRAVGVHLSAATRAGVRVDAGTAELEDVLIDNTQPAADHTDGDGLRVTSGANVTVSGAALMTNRFLGIGVVSPGTTVELDDVIVAGTEARELDKNFGRGIEIDDGAVVTAQRLILESNRDMALVCAGGTSSATTELHLTDAVVRDTRPREKGNAFGNGAAFIARASATLQRVVFERNRDVAVVAFPGQGDPPSVKMEDTIIRDTQSRLSDGRFGRGLLAEDGATVEVDRAVFARNINAGVMADTTAGLAGATITLHDVVVSDTRALEDGPVEEAGGWGVIVQDASNVVAERVLVEDSRDFGVRGTAGAGEGPPTLTLSDLTVRGTTARGDGENGNGAIAANGATMTLSRALFDGNHEVGVLAYSQAGETRTVLRASDLTIKNTLPNSIDGTSGLGLAAVNGVDVTVERALVEGNRFAGMVAYRSGEAESPTLDVTAALVRGTLPQESDKSLGLGIAALEGAHASITRSVMEDNRAFGIFADSEDAAWPSALALTDVVIRNTQESANRLRFGWGMGVQGGSEANVLRALLEDNVQLGVAVFNPNTRVTLSHVVIRGTRRASCGSVPFGEPGSCVPLDAPWATSYGGGVGLGVYEFGWVEMDHVEVTGSPLCGIQVSTGGAAKASQGEIHGNVIGLNVQDEAFDPALLINDTVRWYDNGTNVDSHTLPIPSVADAIATAATSPY
jgi:hypothetical protein